MTNIFTDLPRKGKVEGCASHMPISWYPAHMAIARKEAAERRRLVKTAGEVDLARAAQALLNDFRSGALGRITLEATEE